MKAFPNHRSEGMELRDYFAAKVLPTIMADPDTQKTSNLLGLPFPVTAASLAYTFADALMKTREETRGEK